MKAFEDIPQEELERMERHILGRLNEEERRRFEGELSVDKGLREKYRAVERMLAGLEEAGFRELMEVAHSDIPGQQTSTKERKLIRWHPIAVAASVVMLLLLGLLLWQNSQPKNEKLFAAYFEPDPGLITAMSSESQYEFDRAMVDYKIGEYEEAISRWEKLVQNDSQNDTLLYFLGTSHLALQQAGVAVPYLQEVMGDEGSAFKEDARWYLGLAYILSADYVKAKTNLSKSPHPNVQLLIEQIPE